MSGGLSALPTKYHLRKGRIISSHPDPPARQLDPFTLDIAFRPAVSDWLVFSFSNEVGYVCNREVTTVSLGLRHSVWIMWHNSRSAEFPRFIILYRAVFLSPTMFEYAIFHITETPRANEADAGKFDDAASVPKSFLARKDYVHSADMSWSRSVHVLITPWVSLTELAAPPRVQCVAVWLSDRATLSTRGNPSVCTPARYVRRLQGQCRSPSGLTTHWSLVA
ncbi:hypothetical protein RRG08_027545 [Elysia crispata]|uniref:Uncharacterized protein n=1 Tax=Elysia crispata TaxID=231223 RepID=A0AAE1BDV6_9GAST|nr:hypothetical protein RRG08_027545 [Elysia crispata]